ncbi:unnamed protein product [Calicophoron daubneyi]|uniref:Uncharacterized protein n=1 Tax=Calicophoron daubneyi TaxID=300641 RepID=A0AAV2TIM5_CALDB
MHSPLSESLRRFVFMSTTLSAEEFQRYQTQLLDLREGIIEAKDARLRAEKNARQLEDEVTKLRQALNAERNATDRLKLDELQKENRRLREKLLNTESSFQLQSSTLRAECHRLTGELSQLQNLNKTLKTEASCQTEPIETRSISAQMEPIASLTGQEISSAQEVESLRNALEEAYSAHPLFIKAHQTLEDKVTRLEDLVSGELTSKHNLVQSLAAERSDLLQRLEASERAAADAIANERELRNQLALVKTRGDKLNRELRRQLTRFLRGPSNELDQVPLQKTSVYSSSSSLSSNLTSAPTLPVPNGEDTSVNSSSLSIKQNNTTVVLHQSPGTTETIPSGFFPAEDFKILVDRMSEVQEENCSLRRTVQRLHSDLVAKDKALQLQFTSRLIGDGVPTPVSQSVASFPASSFDTSSLAPSPNSTPTPHSSGSSSGFSFLSLLRPHPSTTLSSANLETVNRLKRMCEELLTQNIKLSEELESARNHS